MNLKKSGNKGTIICIPGLGGHRSAFGGYEKLMPDYNFRYVELVNWEKSMQELEIVARNEKEVILFCSCYGLQLALRLVQKIPDVVTGIVIIEPFFAQFQWWRKSALVINFVILEAMRLSDIIGLKRRKFSFIPDYTRISMYPIIIQPLYDMRWQNLTDYFLKIKDLLTFNLPNEINTKTLFIISKKGFLRSLEIKKRLLKIFTKLDIIEIDQSGHNIITMSQKEISDVIRRWVQII